MSIHFFALPVTFLIKRSYLKILSYSEIIWTEDWSEHQLSVSQSHRWVRCLGISPLSDSCLCKSIHVTRYSCINTLDLWKSHASSQLSTRCIHSSFDLCDLPSPENDLLIVLPVLWWVCSSRWRVNDEQHRTEDLWGGDTRRTHFWSPL